MKRCVLCDAASTEPVHGLLCPACAAELPTLEQGCVRCGRPLAAGSGICGHCVSRASAVGRIVVACAYRFPVDRLVHQLKFDAKLHWARLFGRLIAARAAALDIETPQCLIPVPLHPRRLRARGFNQALEIARHAGAALGIPVATDACRRVRHTPPQSQLTRPRRLDNMRGAFLVRDPPCAAHVAIVDDVLTTGATAEALAERLCAAGVCRVDVWVMARAVPRRYG